MFRSIVLKVRWRRRKVRSYCVDG